jgi:hypothetical protein
MPKLLRSSETAGCGATIKLHSGEVVYVSIAQIGVLVRRWDMSGGLIKTFLSNFFGPKLYNESNVHKNAQTTLALIMRYPQQAPELQFKNPALAAFSNAIWHCASAAEVCVVLNEAAAKVPDAISNHLVQLGALGSLANQSKWMSGYAEKSEARRIAGPSVSSFGLHTG